MVWFTIHEPIDQTNHFLNVFKKWLHQDKWSMTLDDAERARLTVEHKQEQDGRIRDRIKAVLFLNKHAKIS